MKRCIAILVLCCSPAFAASSVVLPAGKTGSVSIPEIAADKSFVMEGRVHNRSVVPSLPNNAFAASFNSFLTGLGISFYLAPQDRVTGYVQNQGHTTTGPPPADFEFRVSKVVTGTAAVRTFEVWDMTTVGIPKVVNMSSSMGTSTLIPASTLQVGHTFADFHFAYLRLWVGTNPASTIGAPVSPSPNTSSVRTIGNVVNYDFEGTPAQMGLDSSGNSRHLSWVGDDPGTSVTPPVPPKCDAGIKKLFRAGDIVTATGAESVSFSGDPLTYRWHLVDQPIGSAARYVDNDVTSSTLRLENVTFGQYDLALTVKDGTMSTSCTVSHGVSAYDSTGAVKFPPTMSTAAQILVGPVTALGMNPLKYAEEVWIKSADEFEAIWGTTTQLDRRGYWDDDPSNWNPGTVTITECTKTINPLLCDAADTAGKTVTCTTPGTCGFRTRVCDASGNVLWTGGHGVVFIRFPVYEGGVLISPAENGWLHAIVASCPDDNTLTLTAGIGVGAPASTVLSGLVWSDQIDPAFTTGTLPNIGTAVNAWSAANPSAIDFYDPALAYYSLYYATGLKKYQTAARWMADRLYSNPINLNKGLIYRSPAPSPYCPSCGAGQEPRDINLTGVILRALDGKPEYWTGIRRVCNYLDTAIIDTSPPRYIGAREEFYALAFLSACAIADPDSTQRSAWVAAVNTQATNFSNQKCGGAAGHDCHGRDTNQWTRDGWGACGSFAGFVGRASGCESYHIKNATMRANVISGNDTVIFTGGTLNYTADHPRYPNQPITFGPDSVDADTNTCTGTGGGTAWSCTEGTRTYIDGMLVSFIPHVNMSAATTTLNYDGTARQIREASGDACVGGVDCVTFTAGLKQTLWANGGIWRVLYPVNDASATGNLRLAMQIRCTAQSQAVGWFWPQRVNSSSVKLRPFSLSLDRSGVGFATWPLANGSNCEFHIDPPVYIGSSTQPFFMALHTRGLAWAYAATVQAGAPNATLRTLLSDTAKWLVDYGYDPHTGGLYYQRTGAACEQDRIPYGVMNATTLVNPGCNYDIDLPGAVGASGGAKTARGLTPEGFGGMSLAYIYEANSTRKAEFKTAFEKFYAKSYGKAGYPCGGNYAAHCDGLHQDTTEQSYNPGSQLYRQEKYYGFAWGFGGSSALPAALEYSGGTWPKVPETRELRVGFRLEDIAGATGIRITLKDQHGTALTPIDCAASPCVVTIPDKLAGAYQFAISYRNVAGNRTLTTGDWARLANN